jgi:uncharacterized membrane protein YoaT (DUF817 family)
LPIFDTASETREVQAGSPVAAQITKTQSAATLWRPLRRFIAVEWLIGARMARDWRTAALYEFIRFGMKEAWACLFGGIMVALLIGTHLFYPSSAQLARYDFLLLAAVITQIALLYFRLETPTEAAVILIYHITGTVMEIFKVSVGSWIYPEPSFLRLFDVPLFTGFMYAAIGSYLFRCWRLFDFRFTHHPPLWALALLSIAIYINFFTHHYVADMRYVLFAATGLLFWRTQIYFRPWKKWRSMPLLLGFVLVALFIWFAENIGTFSKVWLYPHQVSAWHFVALPKLGSWFLLMIISYTLVAAFNRPAAWNKAEGR